VRRRLIALVLGTTLLAVALLGTLLVVVLWRDQVSTAQDRVAESARRAASGIEDSIEAGKPLTPTQLQSYTRDDAVLVAVVSDGPTVRTGPDPEGPVYESSATYGDVTVTVSLAQSAVLRRVLDQALLVLALSVVVLAVSMLVAWFYARRLTRPLEDFAEQADRISTGDARALGRRYGVPELDAVAEVLDRGVSGFTEVLENERRVTNEQSHQLRTPLTALSLRLDAVLDAHDLDEAKAEAVAALGQVDRLSGVIDEVVQVRRGTSIAPRTHVPVGELVADQVREWEPAFRSRGRSLLAVAGPPLVVDVVRGAQAQALATLVENSLAHGAGTTRVAVRRSGGWAVVEVSDEGVGVPADIESRVFDVHVSGASSSGLGLGLARTLVSADGGRLEMVSARPAVFAMFLPTAQPDDAGVEDEPVGRTVGQTVDSSVASAAASSSSGNTQRR
jgi:signal transduction histidine kinase